MALLQGPAPALLQRDPLAPPLHDAQMRLMTYLRLSVTDRCNFRCSYCSPAHWGGKKDHLTAQEVERITSVFAQLGIRRVRLTGGEPTIRPDITEIASRIAGVPGIERVAITTNAARLKPLARPLREAGISQLNMSLDTLSPETFRQISSMGDLASVLEGIDEAAQSGFETLKLNVVVMKGVNDREVPELIRYAHERNIVPRFIELMPFGKGEGVATQVLVNRLVADGWSMTLDEAAPGPLAGPARYYRTSTGHVGFISPMTQNFCGGCNRVRVAANGDLRSCLGGRAQAPLHELIRGGATDRELALAIRRALGEKPDGHRFTEPGTRESLLPMMGIGG
jgi:GTP 3',8-cyclase